MKFKSSITTKNLGRLLPKNRAPTHPGEMLWEEFLRPMQITQTEFAKHIGCTHAKINELINQKRGLTPAFALDIAEALGTSAQFWIHLQSDYDLWHALQQRKRKIGKIKTSKKSA